MEQSVANIAENVLNKKSRKQLVSIILFIGTLTFTLGGLLYTNWIKINDKQTKSIEQNIELLNKNVSNLNEIVVTGMGDLNKKIDKNILENSEQHKGIDKKLELLKKRQDITTQQQFNLIDDLINGKETSYTPPRKEVNEIQILEIKSKTNLSVSNEVLEALIENDNIKKKRN